MTRRRRTVRLVLGLGLAAGLVGLLLGTRGLRVSLQNATSAPLIDVEIAHPGGAIALGRVGPGESVEARVRRPWAGLLVQPRDVPLEVAFTHEGDRSRPFVVHCEAGWLGARHVDFKAYQSKGNRHGFLPVRDPSVYLRVAMAGLHRIEFDRLVRNTLDLTVGPRKFYSYYLMSTQEMVIRRHDWPSILLRQAEVARYVAVHSRDRPIASRLLLLEDLDWLTDNFWPRPDRPEPIHRLPIRDIREAQDSTSINVAQQPYLP